MTRAPTPGYTPPVHISQDIYADPPPVGAALFEHLLDEGLASDAGFLDIDDVDTPTLLGAQATTASDVPGADPLAPPTDPWSQEASQAREAFAAVTSPDSLPTRQRENILNLRVPEAVRHLAGMLTQYDWAFIEQAKEIRGYVVAKLLEETSSPDARYRLRSLELLGKVSAVDLFTTKVEITTKTEGATEVMERIQARLAALAPPAISSPAPFSVPAAFTPPAFATSSTADIMDVIAKS